jgi:nicotinamide-nucleotide amidase
VSLIEAIGLDAERVARLLAGLRERGETVATAESLTGGLVCAVLTAVPGSSAVVRGGLVVYATELKAELAGVDPALLAEHGAVHPVVAAQLARGARRRCGASLGVGLTGVAGPQSQDGVIPGTVYLALTGQGHDLVRSIALSGDRHAVRAGAVRAAIELLEEALS